MRPQRYLATGVRDGIKKRGRTITSLAADVGVPRKLMSDYLALRVSASKDVAERTATVLALPFDHLWTAVAKPLPLSILLDPEGYPILDDIRARWELGYSVVDAIRITVREVTKDEMARARLNQQSHDARRRRDHARAQVLGMAPDHGRTEMEPGVPGRTEALVGSH